MQYVNPGITGQASDGTRGVFWVKEVVLQLGVLCMSMDLQHICV